MRQHRVLVVEDHAFRRVPIRQHLRVQGGCGRREEGENGGKHSEVEACVHIDAASKFGLKGTRRRRDS